MNAPRVVGFVVARHERVQLLPQVCLPLPVFPALIPRQGLALGVRGAPTGGMWGRAMASSEAERTAAAKSPPPEEGGGLEDRRCLELPSAKAPGTRRTWGPFPHRLGVTIGGETLCVSMQGRCQAPSGRRAAHWTATVAPRRQGEGGGNDDCRWAKKDDADVAVSGGLLSSLAVLLERCPPRSPEQPGR